MQPLLIKYILYFKIIFMNKLLIDRLLAIEDAAYIRQERQAGDPSREPDETTEEDVIEALIRRGAMPHEIMRDKDLCTRGLRVILKGIDQQG
jgi:hypothetical protein